MLAFQSTLTRCIYQQFYVASLKFIALECSLSVDISVTNCSSNVSSTGDLTSERHTLRDTDYSIPSCFTRQTRGPRSEKK